MSHDYLGDDYKPCATPGCGRRVRLGVQYCCAPCSYAHDFGFELNDARDPGTHWLHQHSEACEQRVKARMAH